ncbi:MAG: type V CRISPR-associated protein Cas12a/Cpf1, partial [Clostridium sp.]|uniref:type V CRISPR-associated protein Cas12a/Cpf1 n=1 Tax=Clostridium sp. TaxID=1506 RepID=UPI003EE455EE
IPKLKILFKQILSDRETTSFIPETLKNDLEVIDVLKGLEVQLQETVMNRNDGIGIVELFKNIEDYNLSKIYVRNDISLTSLSQMMFGDWSIITKGLEANYDEENIVLNTEKYREIREKYLKKRDSFTVTEINEGLKKLGREETVEKFFKEFSKTINDKKKNYIEDIKEKYNNLQKLLGGTKTIHKKGLPSDIKNKELIKAYLDTWKDFQRFIKLLLGYGTEPNKDERFYSELESIWLELDKLTIAYNKVRNYLTKKPYSIEKIKLNFNNPNLLDGWSKNKEISNSCIMFKGKYGEDAKDKCDDYYYLGIMNTEFNKDFKTYNEPIDEEDVFEKMIYLQAADPAKDVQNFMRIDGKVEKKNGRKNSDGVNELLENLKNTHLPTEINRIRRERTFSREDKEKFNTDDLIAFIDFYKELAIEYYSDYDFVFKESKDYYSFKEFTDHINKQAYQIRFEKVSKKYIESLVKEGKLYLFKVYNKDFSPKSKGTKNLHTLYFKALFDEKNLENVVYKLNGQAEIFFRKKSLELDNTTIHYANIPMKNKVKKDEGGNETTAVYDYDIIKDRRFTIDTFHFHVPITMNFSSDEMKNINEKVNKVIKNGKNINIIGIDRGERNLIYVSVINEKGEILEQKSFNIIKKNENENGKDYHKAIKEKEESRANARVNWDNIEGIKQIKEGYLSQVIHQICLMMEKYNAIVVLENLNGGFKNSRKKFEVSIYQKFEKMLIEKLNYYVNKQKDAEEYGGLLKAYQLTNKFESFKKLGKQSGFLYYVDPWDTSKIDPTTGFVNLYNFKYENVEKAKEIIEKFDRIEFNKDEDYFEFDIDYSKFGDRAKGSKQKWTLCSIRERIINFKNKEKQNNWDSKQIDVTEVLKKLFIEKNIDIKEDIKKELLRSNSKELLKGVLDLIKIMTQLRNSEIVSDRDYIQSPVKNKNGEFYNSELEKEKTKEEQKLPIDADANGAYNIARKGLMLVQIIKSTPEEKLKGLRLNVTREDWLKYAQKN